MSFDSEFDAALQKSVNYLRTMRNQSVLELGSKIIDDTNSEISRVNEIDAVFNTMSLLGESFSYIDFDGRMSGIFRLSWDTSVHFSGARVTRNMCFTTRLHFSVVQVENDTVNTMVRSYTITHTKNLSSGSKQDVVERMW